MAPAIFVLKTQLDWMYTYMKDTKPNLEARIAKAFGVTWRDHVLVKCSRCKGLMSHHIVSDDAVCVGCEIKERCDCGEPLTQEHYAHMTKGY